MRIIKKNSYILISLMTSLLVIASYINFIDSKDNAVELVQKQNKGKLEDVILHVQDYFSEKVEDILVLSKLITIGIESNDYNEVKYHLLNEYKNRGDEYIDIAYFNVEGKMVYSINDSIKGKIYANEKIVSGALERVRKDNKPYITDIFKIDEKNYAIEIIVPIIEKEKVYGYLSAIINSEELGRHVIYRRFEGTADTIFGVNKDGTTIFGMEKKFIGTNNKDDIKVPFTQLGKDNIKRTVEGISFEGIHEGIGQRDPSNPDKSPEVVKKYIVSRPVYLNGEYKFSLAVTIPANSTQFFDSFVIKELLFFIIIFVVTIYNLYNIFRNRKEKRALEKHLAETEEIDKNKTEFFCNMSHELRTPLTIILNALHFILKKNENDLEKDEELKKMFLKIRQNAYRLLKLVNNLLEVSRFESGFVIKQFKNIDIVKVIEDITMSVVFYAHQKGVEVVFDTEIEEKVVSIDEDGIEKVIMNLLSNSLKFTPPGGKIFVSISEDLEYVKLYVKDNGIGIPEEKKDLIFERFTQVDSSLRRSAEGSGIGLSIVKSIVELHEGKIDVFSKEEEGTEFIIYIPNRIIEGQEVARTKKLDQEIVNNINIQFSDI